MTFSYDRVWADVVAMVRSNVLLLSTLAGVFIFLPSLVLWITLPLPQSDGGDDAFKLILDFYQRNLGWLLLVNAFGTLGQVVILVLLLDRNRPTVAEAISGGARLFPGYFLASLIANLAMAVGFFALVVPGLYILGRLAVLAPLIADRGFTNPIASLRACWQHTNGVGWRIVGLVLLVGIVGWIATSAATSVLTVIGSLVLPDALNPLAAAIANALGGAVIGLLMTLLAAGIYRQLSTSKGT